MGCASSTPLIESGGKLMETAKESVHDVVSKGEKTVHETGEKISTEMDHIKEAMQSAATTAGNSVGEVVGKVGQTFSSSANQIKETSTRINLKEETADTLDHVTDAAEEAVSQAETVIMSESENVVKGMIVPTPEPVDIAVSSTTEKLEDMSSSVSQIESTGTAAQIEVEEIKNRLVSQNALEIEDMEQESDDQNLNEQHFDMLGDAVTEQRNKMEEIVNKLPTPATSPAKEPKKEESQPTFWEAAADAILHRKLLDASQAFGAFNHDKEKYSQHFNSTNADVPAGVDDSKQDIQERIFINLQNFSLPEASNKQNLDIDVLSKNQNEDYN